MTTQTYNGKTYPSMKSMWNDLKPNISERLFRQRVAKNKLAGMTAHEAIQQALNTKPTASHIKCITCRIKKPNNEFAIHPTSLTGYKRECEQCKFEKINDKKTQQHWTQVLASMPFGNIRIKQIEASL